MLLLCSSIRTSIKLSLTVTKDVQKQYNTKHLQGKYDTCIQEGAWLTHKCLQRPKAA